MTELGRKGGQGVEDFFHDGWMDDVEVRTMVQTDENSLSDVNKGTVSRRAHPSWRNLIGHDLSDR